MINENKIMNLIGVEIQSILSSSDLYNDYTFKITNDLQFMQRYDHTRELENGKKVIFIVIQFSPATLNYGQTLLPFNLSVISEQNELYVCKQLLISFAETYNLEMLDNAETIKQYYQTPNVMSNFNEIGNAYRSLVILNGTLQISENQNPAKVYWVHTETIDDVETQVESQLDIIAFNPNFSVQLDSQSFYSISDFTTSQARVGTFTISFSLFMVDNEFLNKILYIMTKNTTNEPNGVNTTFKFNIKWKNNITTGSIDMKLVDVGIDQKLGEMPIITLVFTN